jgi:hypothetical protein
MFRLGLRQGMVATMPYISMLAEHNVRKGFFELDQFQAILKHLPNEYHALFKMASITGWRMKSELLTRRWRHVDFGGHVDQSRQLSDTSLSGFPSDMRLELGVSGVREMRTDAGPPEGVTVAR